MFLWRNTGKENYPSNTLLIWSTVSFCTAGNKIDLLNSREIPTHIGQEWADRYEMKFLETSAKEADNVDKLFTEIAKELTEEEREKERLDPGSASSFKISSNTRTITSCTRCFKT